MPVSAGWWFDLDIDTNMGCPAPFRAAAPAAGRSRAEDQDTCTGPRSSAPGGRFATGSPDTHTVRCTGDNNDLCHRRTADARGNRTPARPSTPRRMYMEQSRPSSHRRPGRRRRARRGAGEQRSARWSALCNGMLPVCRRQPAAALPVGTIAARRPAPWPATPPPSLCVSVAAAGVAPLQL